MKNSILVRDHLRINKKARDDYAKVKKEAVRFAKGEGKKYGGYKHKFLQELIKKAKKEF